MSVEILGWCRTCDETTGMVIWRMSEFDVLRCADCGHWAHCYECAAIMSAAHRCWGAA